MAEYSIPRCQVVPQADQQTAVTIDGREIFRWNFGHHYPRPFFHPVIGPSGANLVRMGHPGAPDHDHHSGIWFAHNMIEGFDFWANGTGTQIRQRQWLDYIDGDTNAGMAFLLDYYDGHEPDPILKQTTIVIVHPLERQEYLLELNLRLEPMKGRVTLRQTNFGIVAVRVNATIAEFFGGGTITNDIGQQHESNLFGKESTYMDYSGPVRSNNGQTIENGLTLFDHPGNPNYPSKWHVREDGWIGPSLNRDKAISMDPQTPLILRYQIHVHDGMLNLKKAASLHEGFKTRPGWLVERSNQKHRSWEIKQAKS